MLKESRTGTSMGQIYVNDILWDYEISDRNGGNNFNYIYLVKNGLRYSEHIIPKGHNGRVFILSGNKYKIIKEYCETKIYW